MYNDKAVRDGVAVAQMTLDHQAKVRSLVPQPAQSSPLRFQRAFSIYKLPVTIYFY